MLILRLGDPHVQPSNLDESRRLLEFLLQIAIEKKVDRIEIEGDLFHTHEVIRLGVLKFWRKWLGILSEGFETFVLVGNHDLSGNHSSSDNALSVFVGLNEKLKIIESPWLSGPIGYLPYIHSNSEFIKEANDLADLGARFLVSHTTYAGSKYDNGMYAPDGVDPELIDSRYVGLLSGHVHSEQEYGRVIYPGTARWLTASDANKRKGIWLYSHDDLLGTVLSKEFISTESVCTPLISIEWHEGQPEPLMPEGARVSVELTGTSNWISQVKSSLKSKCSIRTRITDSKKLENRKSGGNLEDYIKNLYISTTDKDSLVKFAKEIGLV